jgi:hypothetical protein
MPRKPIQLPPEVARRFVEDNRARSGGRVVRVSGCQMNFSSTTLPLAAGGRLSSERDLRPQLLPKTDPKIHCERPAPSHRWWAGVWRYTCDSCQPRPLSVSAIHLHPVGFRSLTGVCFLEPPSARHESAAICLRGSDAPKPTVPRLVKPGFTARVCCVGSRGAEIRTDSA